MSQPVPNVPVTALIPRDFIEVAQYLDCTTVELLWLLAEDLCANPPACLEAVARGPVPARSTLSKVIPFPPSPRRSAQGPPWSRVP